MSLRALPNGNLSRKITGRGMATVSEGEDVMQRVKQVTNCDSCGNQIDMQSPPLHEYYQRGQIRINSGTVLLDDKDSPGKSVSHSADLSGYYCDFNCLMELIQKRRRNG